MFSHLLDSKIGLLTMLDLPTRLCSVTYWIVSQTRNDTVFNDGKWIIQHYLTRIHFYIAF